MNVRWVVRSLVPPLALETIRCLVRTVRRNGLQPDGTNTDHDRLLQQYLHGGRIPWSPGYDIYKKNTIVQSLADEKMLEYFRHREPLPAAYGIGVDERCIEYPWLLSHLNDQPETLLDAGSSLNHSFVLDHRVLRDKDIHILTLAPEEKCFWQKRITYLFNDLRDICTRDAYYDTVACLSTLEHVGCDNTRYTRNDGYQEHRAEDFQVAMHEFHRILKPGGSLFLTVPFGVYRHFGTFQQFDRKLLTWAVEAFGSMSGLTITFYRYSASGWQIADQEDCAECEFGAWAEWIRCPPEKWGKSGTLDVALPAAAGAVACVQLIKS